MPGLPRVLIVDYDPKALRALRDLFQETGYQVDTAKDGIAAVASFKQNRPAIVLLEAMIPKKHGFEVCQEIKKTPEGKNTPVIIMTAVYKGRKHRTQAMHVHGCDEYIEKPCTPESILDVVKRFVPPGSVARAMAVGAGQPSPSSPPSPGKLGEVIPFPTERSSYTLPEMDDETEREIMSKLDEILPDTPVFNEKGFGFTTAAASSEAASKIVDFELGPEEDELDQMEVNSDIETEEPQETEIESPKTARPSTAKRPPLAIDPEGVMKLTRSKRRPRQEERPAPGFKISRPVLVTIVLGAIAIIISLILGRV